MLILYEVMKKSLVIVGIVLIVLGVVVLLGGFYGGRGGWWFLFLDLPNLLYRIIVNMIKNIAVAA